MKKTTLIATALVTVLSTSTAFAWWGDNDRGDRERCMGGDRSGHFMKSEHGMRGKHGMKGRNFKEHMNREFTADEIRTLNEARLIMRGNPNIKVGDVTATNDGYKVTIVTKDNSLVKEMDLAKNGMPLERYNMIKERIETRDKK